MKDGFVRFAACSPRLRVADCDFNTDQIFFEMEAACKEEVQVCVFPELSICAATCGDLFFQTTLLEGCERALKTLMEKTAHMEMVTCVGLPVRNGGQLYNCAAVFSKGRLLGLVPKTFLRNQADNGEVRHFAPAPPEWMRGYFCRTADSVWRRSSL